MSDIQTGQISETEYVMVRDFKAPRDLVFRAYTDPELIPQWWGQRASTTVVDYMDPRPGGGWRYIQRAADGTEYAFRGEYLEVTPIDKLVYTFEFEPMPGHVVTDSIEFVDIEGGTRMIATSVFTSRADLDGMVATGMEAGANESWSQLDELLLRLLTT